MNHTQHRTRRTAFSSLLIVVGMFGFGYLMVPIYNVFCDITGLNGSTSSIKSRQNVSFSVDENRTVKVQFVANLNNNLYWDFKPEVFEMKVHPGKQYTTHFVARNKRDETVIGQAIPSIMPAKAALNFHKTECFCFNNQTFSSMEQRRMPVSFIVSPDLPKDVEVMTLSYTFFDVTKMANHSKTQQPTSKTGG